MSRLFVLAAALALTAGCGSTPPPEVEAPPGTPVRRGPIAIIGTSLEVNRITADQCEFKGMVDSDRGVHTSAFGTVPGVRLYIASRIRRLGGNVMVAYIFDGPSLDRARGKAFLCPDAEFQALVKDATVLHHE